jgi:hypothetical protein
VRAFIGLPVWMTWIAAYHATHGRSTRRSVVAWEILGLLEGPFAWARQTLFRRGRRG